MGEMAQPGLYSYRTFAEFWWGSAKLPALPETRHETEKGKGNGAVACWDWTKHATEETKRVSARQHPARYSLKTVKKIVLGDCFRGVRTTNRPINWLCSPLRDNAAHTMRI